MNLALSLAAQSTDPRLRVGLLDLDIFGPSIPKLMGLEGMGEPILTAGAPFLSPHHSFPQGLQEYCPQIIV